MYTIKKEKKDALPSVFISDIVLDVLGIKRPRQRAMIEKECEEFKKAMIKLVEDEEKDDLLQLLYNHRERLFPEQSPVKKVPLTNIVPRSSKYP